MSAPSFEAPETLLKKYKPKDSYQNFCKKTMLDFLADYNHFNRETHVGHFTASACVLNPARTHALLLFHKKLGKWVQPGGHCDGDQNLCQVALKETQEESGLHSKVLSNQVFDLDMHWIPPTKAELGHFHFDVRFLLQAESEAYQKNEESLEMGWYSLASTDLDMDDSVKRMFNKVQPFLASLGYHTTL